MSNITPNYRIYFNGGSRRVNVLFFNFHEALAPSLIPHSRREPSFHSRDREAWRKRPSKTLVRNCRTWDRPQNSNLDRLNIWRGQGSMFSKEVTQTRRFWFWKFSKKRIFVNFSENFSHKSTEGAHLRPVFISSKILEIVIFWVSKFAPSVTVIFFDKNSFVFT